MKTLNIVAVFLFIIFLYPTVLNAQDTKIIPDSKPNQTQINSYELFWPITAGKVMGDSLYPLKLLKENLREALIFSEVKKVDYNLKLSEKRLVEAEYLLLQKKDYGNGNKTLEEAKKKRDKVLSLVKSVKAKNVQVDDLENRISYSFNNQKALLVSIISKLPDQEKKTPEEYLKSIII